MKNLNLFSKITLSVFLVSTFLFTFVTQSAFAADNTQCAPGDKKCIQIVEGGDGGIGFAIPTFSDILTFAIRFVFIVGGIVALVMLLLGAFTWITSGGEKEKTKAAMDKIQAAVLGVIMIAVVLAVVVTLEQVVFAGKICLGLSCGITIPKLLKDAPGASTVVPANRNANGTVSE